MIRESAILKLGIGPSTKKSVTLPPFPVIKPNNRSDILPKAPDKIRNNETKGSLGLFCICVNSQPQTRRDRTRVYSAWPENIPQAIPVLYVSSIPRRLFKIK